MPARVSAPSMVGRDDEAAALEQALAEVRTGGPGLVVIGGEAGAGKTRLLTEFLSRVEEPVLLGGCADLGRADVPYLPLVDMLRGLEQTLGQARFSGMLTGACVPLASLRGGGGGAPGYGAAGSLPLFDAVPALLDRVAGDRAAVVVFEDLHWADTSTLELVTFLVRLGLPGRLVVLTFRSDEMRRRHPLRPVLAELGRLPHGVRLDLGPLSDADVLSLARTIGGQGLSPQFLRDVIARAEGNPFFVEELVAAGAREQLPLQLKDILATRLDGLADEAAQVVRPMSAAGLRVSHALLAAILPGDLGAGLRGAVERGVLLVDEDGYRFRHALLREAAYDDLLAGERTDLHQRLAEVLTARPQLAQGGAEGADGEIAFHALQARDVDTAFTASLRAGERAYASFAFAEAQRHYETALDLRGRQSATEGVPAEDEIREAAARAAMPAGDSVASLAHLRAAADGATDPRRRAVLLGLLGDHLFHAGEGERALTVVSEAMELVGPEPSPERAHLLTFLTRLLTLSDDFAGAIGPGEESVRLCRRFDLPGEEARTLNVLGVSVAGTRDVDEGLAIIERGGRLAGSVGRHSDALSCWNNLGASTEYAGRYEESEGWFRHGLAYSREHGIGGVMPDFIAANLAQGLVRTGRLDEAEELLGSLRHARSVGIMSLQDHLVWADLLLMRGRYDEAAAHVDQAREEILGAHSQQFSWPVLETHVRLLVARGDLAAAVEASRPGLDWGRTRVGVHHVAYLADAAAGLALVHGGGDLGVDSCLALIDDLDAMLASVAGHTMSGDHLPAFIDCAARHLAAQRSRAVGEDRPGDWISAITGADAGYATLGLRLLLRLRLAECHLRHGATADAEAVLVETHGLAARVGAWGATYDAEALARRHRIRLPGVRRDAADRAVDGGLTEREQEVLAKLVLGRTNRQIAEELFISAKTASVHVSNIMAKLGASNRTEAAALARERGVASG